ncbi:MAG: hypothetical protein ACI379_11175 [Nocardioides sp.]|uniref:divisome protein SepX/GlpR n=1 Tax=Nocardioides sp. TaxID=35761 RepID=UPI003F12B6B9
MPDLSSLIFVALAVAWVAYLGPKLLKHHDEVVRSRSVERFSQSMRVLARREAVDSRNARLVVTPARTSERVVETKARPARHEVSSEAAAPTAALAPAARRAAARRATQRRRRVLGVILLGNAVVAGLAIGQVIAWPWVFAPVALLVAWLVACRLMVRSERAAVRRPASKVAPRPVAVDPEAGEIAPVDDAAEDVAEMAQVVTVDPETGEIAVVTEAVAGLWDPVPTTLPTYVSKPAAARRTVQTIDLDSTGVWSSGRSEIDSALAREAEVAEKAGKAAAEERAERKVSGA